MDIHLYQLINVNVNIYRDDESILIAAVFASSTRMDADDEREKNK